jgi:DNA replication protein DnaC
MADAYAEQIDKTVTESFSFDERLGLLVDREANDRENRRLTNRLRRARLREQATLEDLQYSAGRGLNKTQVRTLARCNWIKDKQNVLIVGPTGTGKTYIACALAHKACLEGHGAHYYRLGRLLQELAVARADGSYPKLLRDLAKTAVLVLDDWGISPIADPGRRELLEVLDDRHGNHSTIVTSQLPVASWHEAIGEATLADAILDRLVHNAHRIDLKGESMRRKLATIDND